MKKHHHRDLILQVFLTAQPWTQFVFFINDLPNKLKTNGKLFADNTSLFTAVKDKNQSVNALNNDLSLMSKWYF